MTTATKSTKRSTVIEPPRKRRRKPKVVIRAAYTEEVGQIHGLIDSHRREGHLLPRELDELTRHASRFLVAVRGKRVIACGELAPLSQSLAEIRSLVVDRHYRGFGVGRLLAEQLRQRARRDLFDRLCAFTHQPAYFARLGFSIVPHVWLPEKIGTDCASCVLFRRCGQIAMLDDLEPLKDYRVQGVVAHA